MKVARLVLYRKKMNQLESFYLSEFDFIPEDPGIYSWHLVLRERYDSSILDYHKFFRNRKYSLEAKGPLKDEYEGHLTAKLIVPSDEKMTNLNPKVLEKVTHFFSPPMIAHMERKIT